MVSELRFLSSAFLIFFFCSFIFVPRVNSIASRRTQVSPRPTLCYQIWHHCCNRHHKSHLPPEDGRYPPSHARLLPGAWCFTRVFQICFFRIFRHDPHCPVTLPPPSSAQGAPVQLFFALKIHGFRKFHFKFSWSDVHQRPADPVCKTDGIANYSTWSAVVQLWFRGQGRKDHLTKQLKDVLTVEQAKWKQTDASYAVCFGSLLLWSFNCHTKHLPHATMFGKKLRKSTPTKFIVFIASCTTPFRWSWKIWKCRPIAVSLILWLLISNPSCLLLLMQ